MSTLDKIAAFRTPLSDHIFRLLRHRIISFESGYRPGDQLNGDAIAQELGVSRTPITQAFQRLMYDNLVVVEPRKGTYVRQLSPGEVQSLFELLGHLEAISVRLANGIFPRKVVQSMAKLVDEAETYFQSEDLEAYLEADLAFHREIGCLSTNTKLHETYITIQNQIYLASAVKAITPGDAFTAMSQHRALLEVFESTDLPKIEQAVIEHWDDSYQRYQKARQGKV